MVSRATGRQVAAPSSGTLGHTAMVWLVKTCTIAAPLGLDCVVILVLLLQQEGNVNSPFFCFTQGSCHEGAEVQNPKGSEESMSMAPKSQKVSVRAGNFIRFSKHKLLLKPRVILSSGADRLNLLTQNFQGEPEQTRAPRKKSVGL